MKPNTEGVFSGVLRLLLHRGGGYIVDLACFPNRCNFGQSTDCACGFRWRRARRASASRGMGA